MVAQTVQVIGAGLAGCEAAYALARAGFSVRLREMKPVKYSPAHHSPGFAELVCSNSLKAKRLGSAAGLLKAEMEALSSLTVACAKQCAVPAGGALAVDREEFSRLVTEAIRACPNITVETGEVTELPEGPAVVATGPLTSDALAASLSSLCGEGLRFYDAAAPIVTAESLERDKVFFAARYGRGDDDYINCPFTKEEYEVFYDALIHAQRAELHEADRDLTVYEGCMPVEVMAARGVDTLRYGPLRPVGLTDPRTGRRPWAVVQLRAENREGTLYNLVGFQTNLKFGEQKRVFSLIPGLGKAEFARYGVMHRNTFLYSPALLTPQFALREHPELCFAGQITGVEGYMESAASGILAGRGLARRLKGLPPLTLPPTTMLGALSSYVSNGGIRRADFQPMGANMGILPPLPQRVKGKAERYGQIAGRAMADLAGYLAGVTPEWEKGSGLHE